MILEVKTIRLEKLHQLKWIVKNKLPNFVVLSTLVLSQLQLVLLEVYKIENSAFWGTIEVTQKVNLALREKENVC